MIYLDCEFDSFKGPLISIGMISSITKKEFYGIVKDFKCTHPWVLKNVIPVLAIERTNPWRAPGQADTTLPYFTEEEFKSEVQKYLLYHTGEAVVADWPEDIKHLLDQLYWTEGRQINLSLNINLIQSGKCNPKIPHNALSDARALMEWHRDYLSIPA